MLALPQAIADLISGINQFMFVTTLPVIDLIATGRLRALAVTAPGRITALKEVPSVVEAGLPVLHFARAASSLEEIFMQLTESDDQG